MIHLFAGMHACKTHEIRCKWILMTVHHFSPSDLTDNFGLQWHNSKFNWPEHIKWFQGWLCVASRPTDPSNFIILAFFFLTCGQIEQESVMSFGFTVVCPSLPPSLNAKCRVCEDMQVARCLCNFPPAPFGRRARCNNHKPVVLLSNSAWLEIQRFFWMTYRPLLLCVGGGQGCPEELASSPVESLVLIRAGNSERQSLSQRTHGRGTEDVLAIKDSTICAVYL